MTECERIQDLLDRMADGELSESERAEILRHIETCDECRELYTIYNIYGTAETVEAPEDLLPSVLDAVTPYPAKKRGKVFRFGGLAAAVVAACLLVFILPRFNQEKTAFDSVNSFAPQSESSLAPESALPGSTDMSEDEVRASEAYLYSVNQLIRGDMKNAEKSPPDARIFLLDGDLPAYITSEQKILSDGSIFIVLSEEEYASLTEDGYAPAYDVGDAKMNILIVKK